MFLASWRADRTYRLPAGENPGLNYPGAGNFNQVLCSAHTVRRVPLSFLRPHGRDARATWHGRPAHDQRIGMRPSCRHGIPVWRSDM